MDGKRFGRAMMREVKDYWQARSIVAEQAMERFIRVISNALPHLYPELQAIADNWGRIIQELETEFPEKEE